jgi:hypothetical protein
MIVSIETASAPFAMNFACAASANASASTPGSRPTYSLSKASG